MNPAELDMEYESYSMPNKANLVVATGEKMVAL